MGEWGGGDACVMFSTNILVIFQDYKAIFCMCRKCLAVMSYSVTCEIQPLCVLFVFGGSLLYILFM